ncbi:glutathione S-transferase family protein [Chitinimonas sp. BJYL2]|uniref:glutathione S-transferase family protein n=1 Tax=Chitinimonas sp. BJYL2 TaxID=2976696 RepID=UPI0022B3B64E|nr:glutathione S-transferase family protein [Chitinimonas sp. BJYL2]
MITLHFVPSTASLTPHILLEELGIPFELVEIDKDGGELDSPAYRKLNPNGLIPVLRDGDLVLFETAAICLHLADTHPDAALMPPLATPERAETYKWLSWLSTTLQQTLILYFYPQRWADNEAGAEVVKCCARDKTLLLLEQIDTQLASHGQPWLLGTQFSLVDIYAMMLCRWTRNFPERKARDFTHIKPWLDRVLARPAVQRAFAREGLVAPFV